MFIFSPYDSLSFSLLLFYKFRECMTLPIVSPSVTCFPTNPRFSHRLLVNMQVLKLVCSEQREKFHKKLNFNLFKSFFLHLGKNKIL